MGYNTYFHLFWVFVGSFRSIYSQYIGNATGNQELNVTRWVGEKMFVGQVKCKRYICLIHSIVLSHRLEGVGKGL